MEANQPSISDLSLSSQRADCLSSHASLSSIRAFFNFTAADFQFLSSQLGPREALAGVEMQAPPTTKRN
jgi:hypothetical protein